MRRNHVKITSTNDGCDGLLGELQHALAGLANAEMRHEMAREQIERSAAPVTDKQRRSNECDSQYRLEREPYPKRLNHLQRHVRFLLMPGF
jgi:hypothetical protein